MRHILLEGPSGHGKTTALIKYIKESEKKTGGFITQRVVRNGEIKGFCITPAAQAVSPSIAYEPDLPGIFLKKTETGWVRKDSAFIEFGLPLLKRVPGMEMIVLDEIGGLELMIPAFYGRVLELLEGEIPCIGVLKSPDNSKKMRRSVETDEDYPLLYERFREYLKKNSAVSLISRTETDALFNRVSDLILG